MVDDLVGSIGMPCTSVRHQVVRGPGQGLSVILGDAALPDLLLPLEVDEGRVDENEALNLRPRTNVAYTYAVRLGTDYRCVAGSCRRCSTRSSVSRTMVPYVWSGSAPHFRRPCSM